MMCSNLAALHPHHHTALYLYDTIIFYEHKIIDLLTIRSNDHQLTATTSVRQQGQHRIASDGQIGEGEFYSNKIKKNFNIEILMSRQILSIRIFINNILYKYLSSSYYIYNNISALQIKRVGLRAQNFFCRLYDPEQYNIMTSSSPRPTDVLFLYCSFS